MALDVYARHPMPSRLTDETWLRERVNAYARNVEIAAEAGVTARAVRYALRRFNIERPPRHDLIDIAVAEYRAGTPLAQIGAKVNRGPRWVSKTVQMAGAQRPPTLRRRRPKYPELGGADWLTARVAAGGTVRSIARELGADRHTVRTALLRHGPDRLPAQLAMQYRQAVDIEAEARRRQANVVAELSGAVTAWPTSPDCWTSRPQPCGSSRSRIETIRAASPLRCPVRPAPPSPSSSPQCSDRSRRHGNVSSSR